MDHLPFGQNTAGTIFPVMPDLAQEDGCGYCFAIRRDDLDPVGRKVDLPDILVFLACAKQQHN